MCIYKIYCAKIASSSFVLQNCFRIKIIGSFRSQKSLCNGRCRRSERHQGCRPSLAGYQENFLASAEAVRDASQAGRVHQENFAGAPRSRKASGTPAEHLKSSYPANFAGGRSHPETSEGVRDAGQVWPGTRRTLQPPRGLGKYQNAPLNVSEASESSKTRR